jgi:soluble lytic murein transglycosylase
MMKRPSEPRDRRRSEEHAPRMKWLIWPLVAAAALITVQAWNTAPGTGQDLASAPLTNTAAARLNPTAHPAVPATLEAMWYAGDGDRASEDAALANLARGVTLLDATGDAAAAFPLVSASALAKTDVADYARYYTGIALQRLSRLEEADAAFATVAASKTDGQLREAAAYRRAEIREARMDFSGAAAIYEQLLEQKVASPQIALVKLGAASSAAGNRTRAIEAHRRVLREYTLSSEAAEADELLERLGGFAMDTPEAVAEELGRAEALFKARKWDQAKSAYERVSDRVDAGARDRVTLRLGQIQAANRQHRAAREVFRRFVNHETLGAEAQYGVLAAARELGEKDEFRELTADFVARHPNSPLAQEALHELARRHILDDEDGKAAAVYTQLVARFPSGAFAERAVWKAGWWAYREKNFAETVRLFEHGAATFPRSDFRPSWLYWSARAYDRLGDATAATERYRLTATDYLNTYYGRLAWRQLEQRQEATVTPGIRRAIVTPPSPPPNVDRISRLIELGLYRPALNELQYAQKVWGDSAPLQATIALVHHKMGNLRLGINAMKRAYPQYMTAGGETLPRAILEVIFPLDYWPLLKGNAQAHGLDPYIIAALAAQESTFDAAIRSPANAIGLMQLIPGTGRRYAKKVGLRSFSERSLENPEINARLGTQYFADLVNMFGGHHYALASYNAGEHRVKRWNAEAPGLPQDEWIDNIPFPETQNYVKRILGSAEDYRRLYGAGQTPSSVARPIAKAAVKRPPVKKSTAKKPAAGKKKPVVKKATAKRAPARKATAKRAPARKATSTRKPAPVRRGAR